MDAFFASVEQRDNSAYAGKPVIVGAKPHTRGVVSAASYEARKFGVHSALPISEAYRRCPQGIFVTPRMDAYIEASRTIMKILRSFSPCIEPLSIDEAFCDLSGTKRLWGTPAQAGKAIQQAIKKECSLSASVGIGPNKFIAKIASDLVKPHGLTLAPFDDQDLKAWLSPLPVSRIWGVGAVTEKVLLKKGIATIGQLQTLSRTTLTEWFGSQGDHLYELARGCDTRPVLDEWESKSISREKTFQTDTQDIDTWKQVLHECARDVAFQARKEGKKGYTIFAVWRTADFLRHTRQKTLPEPTWLARDLYTTALELLIAGTQTSGRLRLVGLGLTGFNRPEQTSLLASINGTDAWERSEQALDTISQRFGLLAVVRAGELKKQQKK
jgi:nucleotidyltransferase/DNA polymerase involved in DNA repair